MQAVQVERDTFIVYDLSTRFVHIVDRKALQARLDALYDDLREQRAALVALRNEVNKAEVPAPEALDQTFWLPQFEVRSAEISRRINELTPEYRQAKEMMEAVEAVSRT